MTTVAYRDKVMAADTQMSMHDSSRARISKINRLPDGSLFACAGSVGPVNKLKRWGLAGFPEDKKPRFTAVSDVEGLLVKPDGSIWFYDWMLDPDRLTNKFYAIGSGGIAARAAMMCGKSAKQAIKIAAELDVDTSEPVETMELVP